MELQVAQAKIKMDKLISKLEELTNNLVEHLDTITYEEIEQFVMERQKVLESIEISYQIANVTRQQKERVHHLLQHDSSIIARMQILANEAQDWLQQRNIAKVQRNTYAPSYAPDSILMDRKK